jgi:hypothetical protein
VLTRTTGKISLIDKNEENYHFPRPGIEPRAAGFRGRGLNHYATGPSVASGLDPRDAVAGLLHGTVCATKTGVALKLSCRVLLGCWVLSKGFLARKQSLDLFAVVRG